MNPNKLMKDIEEFLNSKAFPVKFLQYTVTTKIAGVAEATDRFTIDFIYANETYTISWQNRNDQHSFMWPPEGVSDNGLQCLRKNPSSCNGWDKGGIVSTLDSFLQRLQ